MSCYFMKIDEKQDLSISVFWQMFLVYASSEFVYINTAA